MPIDPKRVQAVFLAAVEQSDPANRAAVLDRECGDDAELHRRVEALLKANDDPASFLDKPAVEAAPDGTGAFAPGPDDSALAEPSAEAPGQWIGPYRLLQKIGEGGMGTVWMAEQEHPVRRRVALKVIKPGMDSAQVIARFEAERQALALMDHQNIAKVLDAGTAPHGRPYFVMELIRGVPITKFCDEHHLTPKERLELFVPVCQAVQHAHQKGVIHRDLKPSNVLVTLYDGRPVPKVIDFGVAKAMHTRLTDRTLFTDFGAVVGTLEYMAPEQAALSHLDVDTRSDVYSLGVLLYELLTGTTPFEKKRLRQAALDEVLRIIREEEPPKPSTRLSESGDSLPSIAALRKTEPAKLSRLVRGELDWIVMRALEKDRTRRYETANGFARDIQRYLADEPVEACPPSAAYLLGKLARRHRGALTTSAVILVILTAAAAVSIWQAVVATHAKREALLARDEEAKQKTEAEQQRDEATEQRRRTRQALDDMLGAESLAFLTTQKALLPEQKAFLERAMKYYQEFASQVATDPEGRALVGRAHLRVGRIFQRLGKRKEAEAAYQASLEQRTKLAADYPTVPNYRLDMAVSHYYLGELLDFSSRPAESETAYRAAVAIEEKLNAEFPAVADYRYELATSHRNLGRLLRNQKRFSEAEGSFRKAVAMFKVLAAESPTHLRELALCHNSLALLLNVTERQVEAETEYRAALAVHEKLVAEFATDPVYRSDLAHIHNNLGVLFRGLRKTDDAEREYREALVVREKLATDYPAVPENREVLAQSYANLAHLFRDTDRRPAAVAQYQAAIAVEKKLAADFPAVASYRQTLAGHHEALGRLMIDLGKRPEAVEEFRAAMVVVEKLATDDPAVPDYRRTLARGHNMLGILLQGLTKLAEAEAAYHSSIAASEKLATDFPAAPQDTIGLGGACCNLGELIRGRGEPAAGLGWFTRAITLLESVHRSNPQLANGKQFLRNSHYGRAMALVTLDRPRDALADWERALELDDGASRVTLQVGRADALVRIGEVTKALASADELVTTPNLNANRLYDLACVYALCAAKLPTADADRPAARAVEVLRQAILKGYRNFAHLLKDSDLDGLRHRDDYATLLWDLADLPSGSRPGS